MEGIKDKLNRGDIPFLAKALGKSEIYVRQVLAGDRRSEFITQAAQRWVELKEQFRREFNQQGNECQD